MLEKEMTNRTWAILVILILVVSGTTGVLVATMFQTETSMFQTGTNEITYEPLDISIPPRHFGNYTEYRTHYVLNAPQYEIKSDLSNIINLKSFYLLSDQMKQAIVDHYFVAGKSDFRMFYDIYKWNYENNIPSFVTTDSILHAYHVLYDLTLRSLEETHFRQDLYNLSLHLVEVSLQQYFTITDSYWKDLAKKNVAYFSVVAKLLNSSWEIPTAVAPWVNYVLYLIRIASGFNDQWFMHQMIDWTQFIPRGHYTRTQELQQYFQAVIWLSRISFRLEPEDFDAVHNPLNLERGRNETAQAILLCVAMRQPSSIYKDDTSKPMDQWMRVYDTTSFLIGTSDDLTPYEYQIIIDSVYDNPNNYTELMNSEKLGIFIETAKICRDPQILSGFLEDYKDLEATKGLRFLGQRFIPDSYVFCQLTHKQVPFRQFPKALDIMAALGSERAWELLDDQKSYENYTEQMNMLQEKFSNLPKDFWTQNMYWLWLYTFKILLDKPTHGPGHPSFMLVPQWIDKQLVTCLGTWTELRHDTVLYTKHSYSFYYCYPSPPPGYVEPVPELYAKVASLCNILQTGLEARKIDDIATISRLKDLQWLSLEMKTISEKELSRIKLNDSEWEILKKIGDYIADIEGTENEAGRAALIADVHTDPTTGEVLEEATGNPMYIIVAVPDEEGNIFLAKGAMYSHYEFTVPMSSRLTDEMWWYRLEHGESPPMADWMGSFVLGVGTTSGQQQQGQFLSTGLGLDHLHHSPAYRDSAVRISHENYDYMISSDAQKSGCHSRFKNEDLLRRIY